MDKVARSTLHEALLHESRQLSLVREAYEDVGPLGLWPPEPVVAAAFGQAPHQTLPGVVGGGLQGSLASAALTFGDEVAGEMGDGDPYFSTPEEFWEGWESSDEEEEAEAQAQMAFIFQDVPGAVQAAQAVTTGDVSISPNAFGPLPLAYSSPRVPLVMPEGKVLTPCPTIQLCLAPPAFRCSFDGRVCWDPVQTPGAVLFDRQSIVEWLRWNKVCPVTGSPLSTADLTEAAALKSAIQDWLEREGSGIC